MPNKVFGVIAGLLLFWAGLVSAQTQEEYNAMGAAADAAYAVGDYADAAQQYEAFAAVAEGFFGPSHVETLYIRSKQAFALEKANRFAEVESLATSALAAGAGNDAAQGVLIDLQGSLGRALFSSGQNERAFAVAESAVAEATAYAGPDAPLTVILRLDRARAAAAIGSDEYLRKANDDFAFVAAVTRASPDAGAMAYAAQALREQSWVATRLLDDQKAAALLAEAVPLYEASIGPDHFDTLSAMQEQVDAVLNIQDAETIVYIDALHIATQAAERAARAFGEDSPIAAETLAQRGYLMLVHVGMTPEIRVAGLQVMDIGIQQMERVLPAQSPRLELWRFRLAMVIAYSPDPGPAWVTRGLEVARVGAATKSVPMRLVAKLLEQAEATGALDPSAAAEQALATVQELQFGMAPAVMGFWQKRLEHGNGPVQDLYRDFTDITLVAQQTETELLALASRPIAERDHDRFQALQNALADLRAKSDGLARDLSSLDPTFGANFAGEILGLSELRALLAPDEAVVVLALPDARVSDASGMIVAVSGDAIAWAPLDAPPEDYLTAVAALREAIGLRLGVRAAQSLAADNPAEPVRKTFPSEMAVELYALTLAKVEHVIKGKAHLYLDMRGAMASIPPSMLLVSADGMNEFATADWLIRHYAVTVIPSLTSLRTIDLARGQPRAEQPLLAFADPAYNRTVAAVSGQDPTQASAIAALRSGLAPLPETAGEARAVAASLGGSETALHLGINASEAVLKSEPLSSFRVLHFATHGLVSGDSVGQSLLGEPALALTPGEGEDGFLKASEVIGLRLNADLVALSACNTAAGNKPDDEALSGLAQAFLYAGARSLLVSHWPVESKSAAHLMTDMFGRKASAPEARTAEALRQTMLAMIDDTQGGWAHPAYWSPFVLVGSPE